MRISDAFTHRFVGTSTARAKSQYFEAGEDTVLLRRIERPSDDLASAQKILLVDRAKERLNAMERSRDKLQADLALHESALQGMTDELTKLKELAIQMGNDSLNANDRAAGAASSQAMRQTMFDLLNSRQSDGRYLFSGTAETTPAYHASGAFLGNVAERQVEVSPGRFVGSTFSGLELYQGGNPLLVVDTFMAALESNDLAGIQEALDNIDGLLGNTSVGLTEVGVRIQAVNSASAIAEEMDFHFTRERSELQDLDLSEAVTRFDATEHSLNAVIAVSKRLMDMTIMPWLR